MQPIGQQRIDSRVYEQLLDNIKGGVWKAGDKLPSESELCDILQVSRVSVRSALQRLQALGFIEVKRAKGSFVCSTEELFDFSGFNDTINLSRKEYHDIAELREMIEAASIEILLMQKGDVDLSTVSEAYAGMAKAVEDMDLASFTRNDHKFHLAIILATGNDKFAQIAQIFREDFYHFLRESNKFILRDKSNPKKYKEHFEKSLVWHTELHRALLERDERAIEIQKNHLTRNLERLEHYYNQDRRLSHKT